MIGRKSEFDAWLQKFSLFFGAAWDILLVRYFIESIHVSRQEILSSWGLIRDDEGTSAHCHPLQYAMGHGQKDTVEYLLQDWGARSFVSDKIKG